jgi:hypothetical protein
MTSNGRSSRRTFFGSVAGASLASLTDESGFAKGSIFLIAPGEMPYSVFVSAETSASERWAAEELRNHIEQITGSRMRIDEGAGVPSSSRRVIAIGRSGFTDSLGITPPEGESCLIKTAGESVVIAGGRQRGTMYGVSIFLEKLGCRWFTPDVPRIPRSPALQIPEIDEVHRPAFGYREVFFTEAQGRDWSARNRLNGHFHKLDDSVGGKIVYMPFAHSFYDLVPPGRYFGSHPEYFALVDGRRRSDHAQLCLTNSDVLRLAVEQAERWLHDNPDVSIVSVSQNDGGGWCECDPCRKITEMEGGKASGLALRFVNQVAERLAVSFPGKTVDMLAYQDTADPPAITRPLANVQIRLCPIEACQAHSYRTCVFNRAFRERLENWSRIAPRLHIWGYSVNFAHYLAPFPNYDALISGIPEFRRAGVSGLFVEGAVSDGGGGDDAELRSYLAARLLWNPETDAESEIRGFLRAVYGPAAPLMWSYFVLRQQTVRHGDHLWIDQNLDAPYLTAEFLRDGRALLQGALRRATTGAARRRVRRQMLSFDYVEAMRAKRCLIQSGAYGPADPVKVKDETQRFLAAAGDLGVTHLREGYPIGQQTLDWGDVTARYATVLLTDGPIEAVLVPELGARIIAFGRKNILRVADPGELGYPRAGGIHINLFDGDLTVPQTIDWQTIWAGRSAVTLSGKSDGGRLVHLETSIADGVLTLSIKVSNPENSTANLRIVCAAELDFGQAREARLTFRDRSGSEQARSLQSRDSARGGFALSGREVPQGVWTMASGSAALRFENGFQAGDETRCVFRWSFAGATGLNAVMSVSSPEVKLSPGAQFNLMSNYRMIG